jgi:hypothetical protein
VSGCPALARPFYSPFHPPLSAVLTIAHTSPQALFAVDYTPNPDLIPWSQATYILCIREGNIIPKTNSMQSYCYKVHLTYTGSVKWYGSLSWNNFLWMCIMFKLENDKLYYSMDIYCSSSKLFWIFHVTSSSNIL